MKFFFFILITFISFSAGFNARGAIPRGESFPKTGLFRDLFSQKDAPEETIPEKLIVENAETQNFMSLHFSKNKRNLLKLVSTRRQAAKNRSPDSYRDEDFEQRRQRSNSGFLEVPKKWVAVLLAFPLPLGILGAHRIYLGTKPVVPVVYIVTLGGAAGILPLIDFIVLALAEDLTPYENNPNIIMWMNDVK